MIPQDRKTIFLRRGKLAIHRAGKENGLIIQSPFQPEIIPRLKIHAGGKLPARTFKNTLAIVK